MGSIFWSISNQNEWHSTALFDGVDPLLSLPLDADFIASPSPYQPVPFEIRGR